MKSRYFLLLSLTLVLANSMFVSCSSDDVENLIPPAYDERNEPNLQQEYTAKLRIDISKDDFDGANSKVAKRSVSQDWKDGDKLYLVFTSGEKTVSGIATYSQTDDWTLKYNGLLARDAKTNVKVFYFTNVISSDNDSLYIDATCGVYKDEEGTYLYPSGTSEIQLSATLRPITGRLRFVEETANYYNLDGISYYSSFSLSSGELSVSSEPLFDLYEQDYIYGFFPSTSNRKIRVKNDNYLYSADCPNGFLQIRKSGFVNMPTHKNHNGWSERVVGGWFENESSGVSEKWVDLALPSGIRWASDDFWAEDEYGELDRDDYSDGESYPWGATWFSSKGKTDNYSSKTIDISGTATDPIWLCYGKIARCPKAIEFQELVDNLIWKKYCGMKTTGEKMLIGVIGYCASNLTHIVLYASGYNVWDFSDWTAERYEDYESGYYWTSTPYNSSKAYCFKFTESNPVPQKITANKGWGMLMHPVICK